MDDPVKLRSKVEIITPEIAMAWLEKNEENRILTQATIDKYARDMLAGRWKVTGEALIFGASGRLLNGQHRLWACITAGVPFQSLVVRGVQDEEDVMDVLDTTMKRTLAHALQIHGETDTRLLAAIVNMCLMYEAHRFSVSAYPSHAEGVAWLRENEGVRQAALIARVFYGAFKAQLSPVGAAYYLNAMVDAEASERFWMLAASGDGLAQGDPILAFRRFVIGVLGRRDKPLPQVWLAHNLKAMNAWREGRSLKILSWKDTEDMPETWASAAKKRRT